MATTHSPDRPGRSEDMIENIVELSEEELPRGDCTTVIALANFIEFCCGNCGQRAAEVHEC